MEKTQVKGRSIRRHQAYSHMWRRLKEDRNQHYDDLTCPCWYDPKAMGRFKEQPQMCSQRCCGNPRKWEKGGEKLTRQERRCERVEGVLLDTI